MRGASIKPGEPGEALPREPLNAGDVLRPLDVPRRVLSWPARPEGRFGIGNKHYRSRSGSPAGGRSFTANFGRGSGAHGGAPTLARRRDVACVAAKRSRPSISTGSNAAELDNPIVAWLIVP
jgi:hypothetical protein